MIYNIHSFKVNIINNTMAIIDQSLSIYIPHIYGGSAEDTQHTTLIDLMKETFKNKNIGIISRIDLRKSRAYGNSKKVFLCAFIRFENWIDSPFTREVQSKILKEDKNDPAKIKYNNKNFWILLKNTSKNNPGSPTNVHKIISSQKNEIESLRKQLADMTCGLLKNCDNSRPNKRARRE